MLDLDLKRYVAAPICSGIYSDRAMTHFKQSSIFVFLSVSFDTLRKRLNTAQTRGVVEIKRKGFHSLFDVRVPLYEKYANIFLDCSGRIESTITKELIHEL